MLPHGWVFERFVVDLNVAHLARWLRFMGYDILLYEGSQPSELLKIARSGVRTVLAQNSRLMGAGLKPAPSQYPSILLR